VQVGAKPLVKSPKPTALTPWNWIAKNASPQLLAWMKP
jgi:hypothetical protein